MLLRVGERRTPAVLFASRRAQLAHGGQGTRVGPRITRAASSAAAADRAPAAAPSSPTRGASNQPLDPRAPWRRAPRAFMLRLSESKSVVVARAGAPKVGPSSGSQDGQQGAHSREARCWKKYSWKWTPPSPKGRYRSSRERPQDATCSAHRGSTYRHMHARTWDAN